MANKLHQFYNFIYPKFPHSSEQNFPAALIKYHTALLMTFTIHNTDDSCYWFITPIHFIVCVCVCTPFAMSALPSIQRVIL